MRDSDILSVHVCEYGRCEYWQGRGWLYHGEEVVYCPQCGTRLPEDQECAHCGALIVSWRPRKRGTRWFCDPVDGKAYSDCANRFFSAQSKRRKREAGEK